MKYFLVLLAVIAHTDGKLSGLVFQEIAKFSGDNGFKFVTYVGGQLPKQVTKWNSAYGVRTRVINSLSNFIDFKIEENIDALVVVHEARSIFNHYLLAIQKVKVKRSMLIMSEANVSSLVATASLMAQNLLFYVFSYEQHGISSKRWLLTIKGSGNVVLKNLEFNHLGQVIDNYNLDGLNIVATSLTWPPSIEVKDCNKFGRGCKIKGLLVDLMNIWAKDVNFTWDIYADVNNSWGSTQVSGNAKFSPHWYLLGPAMTYQVPRSY